MRLVLLVAAVVSIVPARAHACIRASEADKLVAWSADGAYSLLEAAPEDPKASGLGHAEILPTTYQGFVYTVMPGDDGKGMVVSRVPVGTCASFGDEADKIVERSKLPLTHANILLLKTFSPMKFGRDEGSQAGPLPSAAFTGAKRYDTHDLAMAGTTMPIPVWCVGSCLADENFSKWKVTVDATHILSNGKTLYEVSLSNVCNGGTLHRLLMPTPPSVKVPKHRCTGSGDA